MTMAGPARLDHGPRPARSRPAHRLGAFASPASFEKGCDVCHLSHRLLPKGLVDVAFLRAPLAEAKSEARQAGGQLRLGEPRGLGR